MAYEDYLLDAYLWLLLGILFRLPTVQLYALIAAIPSAPEPLRDSLTQDLLSLHAP